MNEFTKTLEAKSDQINNPDLASGPVTVTIKKFGINLKNDQPVSISLEETDKLYRPSKGMRRLLAAVWGDDPQKFIGRKITIYQDPEVTFGKDKTGGIRISHMSNIDKVMRVTVPVSRNKYREYTVEPIKMSDAHVVNTDAILSEARTEAAKGKDVFTVWWKANKQHHGTVMPIMAELKALMEKAIDDEIPM